MAVLADCMVLERRNRRSQGVLRPMAWAQISARPVRRRVSRTHIRVEGRHAAKMGANAYHNGKGRIDRPVPVLGVGRLLERLRVRVAQIVDQLGIL